MGRLKVQFRASPSKYLLRVCFQISKLLKVQKLGLYPKGREEWSGVKNQSTGVLSFGDTVHSALLLIHLLKRDYVKLICAIQNMNTKMHQH